LPASERPRPYHARYRARIETIGPKELKVLLRHRSQELGERARIGGLQRSSLGWKSVHRSNKPGIRQRPHAPPPEPQAGYGPCQGIDTTEQTGEPMLDQVSEFSIPIQWGPCTTEDTRFARA